MDESDPRVDYALHSICGQCQTAVRAYETEVSPADAGVISIRWDWDHCDTLWSWTGEYDLPMGGIIVHALNRKHLKGLIVMPWGPFGRTPAYVEGPPRAPAPVPSPIEGQFWSAYTRLHPRALRGLVPQHKVGPFRIDFALPRQKFGIELDGLRDHASTEAMARDRARERYLMRQGWIIVRFGGTEVYHNAIACVQEAADLANHDKKVRR